MAEFVQNEENVGMVPPSTGKKKKARRVFGNILSNGDVNHSLSYTPSPCKKMKDPDESQSPSKSQDDRLATNLFSIRESTGGSTRPAASRKSEGSSSQLSTCRSASSTVVVQPFSKIIGITDDTEKENSAIASVPRSIRVPSEKSSVESKLSVESFERNASMQKKFYTKEERLAKTAKPYKPYTGMRSSSITKPGRNTDAMAGRTGSVNRALNAARRARERTLREKAKAAAKVKGQWKEEKEEALEFHEETEKLRREQLNLQNQFSSNFSRAKAQRNLNQRHAQREKIDQEAIFKSDVAREQRQKLKEMQDRCRRESIAARANIRRNNREGAEKLNLIRIEEEQAIHEERHASSQAFQQYKRDRLDSARKNYQFRRGDAIRIRELHDKMEKQRKKEEHESFELMLAAARDTDSYRNELARQRRESLEGRNAHAREQRERAEELRTKTQQAEHESYELKRAAEKDAESHKRELEEQRRTSLAFRGEEAQKQREILSGLEADNKKAEHESYQLKFEADKDVDEYKQREALLRRRSLEQRGATARDIREKELKDESQRMEQEHKSWELKFAGDQDADQYRREMDAKRRLSLKERNDEAKRQRDKEEQARTEAQRLEHESYELKWDGERDAQEYLRQTEQKRRESLNQRNLDAKRQRDLAEDQRSAELRAEHESFELKRAANKDVDEYRMKMEQERRDSVAFRNKEKARHAKVMEELNTIAKEQEAESYMLKWGGEEDAKAYQAKLEEERRNSIRFGNEEAKRHREIDDELHREEVVQQHKDEELRAVDHKDMERYKEECAERDRASLEFRGKEVVIRRLEEMNTLQKERETEERNHQLESLARIDVQEYIKNCKSQRRKSLALRAKEKRRHADWVRKEEQREIEQRSMDTRLRGRDLRSMELARQKEKTEKALDALRHANRTFSSFPAAP